MTGYEGTNSGAAADINHLVFDTATNVLVYDDSSIIGCTTLTSTCAAVVISDNVLDFTA